MRTIIFCKQSLLSVATLVFVLVSARADIIPGTSRDQVIRELGQPDSTSKIGQDEICSYKSGITITLRNGVVHEMSQRGRVGPVTVITGHQAPTQSVSPGATPVTPATPRPQPATSPSLLPNGTGLWPSAPGDGVMADRFGDTYPFTYGEPPRDVWENHHTYWLDSVEFYRFAHLSFSKSPEYTTNDYRLLAYYFGLAKPDERKKIEQNYQQTHGAALQTHPRYSIYMLQEHLDRANGDYGKARDNFIKTEALSYAKPFSLDSAIKPESRPLVLMLKDALARMYYCRTRLAREFPAYCDQDNAYSGVTEFNPDPDWKQVGNKTECPWTDPGWNTYAGDTDFTYNDYLGRDDATLFRGQRVTGPNVTGQTNWFIVKNFNRKTAPRINTGVIQAIVLRCKSLGMQPTPNMVVDRIEQPQIELLDLGVPAPSASRVTKQIADARNAARKEAHDRIRAWKVLNEALALDEAERRYREAARNNPNLTRSAFERVQRDQRRQQPTHEQRVAAERQQAERIQENQKQRVAQQAAAGDADATYQLAQAYLFGVGQRVDEAKGNALMKEAAGLGDIAAKLYLHKQGPTLNAEQTKQWVREAKAEVERLQKEADSGNAKAKRQLAKAYLFGYGVDPDPGKAGRLMKEAVQMDPKK